ncbi:MAG: hypothetical protein P4M01_06185 [Acidobacteriota bacterium]|nr:hypothetical protein [Acidobacteriota bacterium]
MKPLLSNFALLAAALLAMPLLLAAQTAPTAPAKTAAPLLPEAFAGWELSGTAQQGTEPHKLDATSAAVLAEDRFKDYEIATYKNGGRTLTLRAARFADAEGAYAAFTFFRQPRMRQEEIGTLAASLNERVLFFVADIVVDAQFDHLTGMSGSQLRELAKLLPAAKGSAAELPALPNYLPRKRLVPQTSRYLIGPAAFAALNSDLPATAIDFNKSPQILWSRIDGTAPGSAELLMVSYPTHIIAMQQLAALEQLPAPLDGGVSLAKRSGPILALVRGQISNSDAQRVLGAINYDANVTWNENAGRSKRDNIGNLVVAALTLAGIFILLALGSGAVFGFGKHFLHHLWFKTTGRKMDDGAMIRLDLEEHKQEPK